MSPRATKLPEEVRAARIAYQEVKLAHGICRVLSCTRPVHPGQTCCDPCRTRHAASTARYEARRAERAALQVRDGGRDG